MKTYSFFVLFVIVALVTTIPAAFANDTEITISPASGSGTPGCEETAEGCNIPKEAIVDVGGKVIFSNTDTAAHTFTAGTAAEGPSGAFDSGLAIAGSSYEWTPTTIGEFPYFCMVHPWMVGLIVVQEAGTVLGVAEGLIVIITNSAVNDGTQVDLEFNELHVNYEIIATQGGEIILQETAHAMKMTASHMVDAVGSNENPIDIEIVSLGIGAPGAEENWTGPVGTVATSKIVPEFGTIAMMILVVSIISIVVVTAKSKVIPRF